MKMIDITGNRYGKLIVLDIDEENRYTTQNRIQWKCQCDCGNICYKTKDQLERPNKIRPKACTTACGSIISNGTRFGRLVIINPIFGEGKETKYNCKCDCGNNTIVPSSNLKSGTTKSCGCLKHERVQQMMKDMAKITDIRNQRFGKLIALEPTENRQNRSVIWKCQCDCGKEHYASLSNLKSGNVTRCSYCNIKSKGEEKISTLLEQNNITFSKEKTFSNCRFLDSNRMARFDFYVEDKYLIEFDGKQHFCNSSGWNTEENVKAIQQRDLYKNNWCKEHNIPLIRIPYTMLDTLTLEDLKLETTKNLI